MSDENQEVLEYDLIINGKTLHICRDSASKHSVFFEDSNLKSIREFDDEWIYHEGRER